MALGQNPPPTGEVRHQVGVVVVAAGESRRMGGVDKIFAPLLGMPLIAHTVELFELSALVQELVLVLSPSRVDEGVALAQERRWQKVVAICPGGLCRQNSVRNGLERLSSCDWVVVHDGARPCLDSELLQRGLEAVRETGAAVAAIPATDTVKVVSSRGLVESTPNREHLWMVQTPQIFDYQLFLRAHQTCHQELTDDAAMVEALGHPIKVFMGSYHNLKVTTPQDLILAETLIKAKVEQESTG